MGKLISPSLYEVSALGSLRGEVIAHWCPSCGAVHEIAVEKPDIRGAVWVWNHHPYLPSIAPSIDKDHHKCVYSIREGRIEYTDQTKNFKFSNMILPLPIWVERRKHERVLLESRY